MTTKPASPFVRARAAYRGGGLGEVVRGARRRLARAVWPGELVVARPGQRRRPPRTAKAPRHNAVDVSHEDALAFFEQRRPTYERLAHSVARYVGEDDLVLDVGANIGFFSLVLGEVTGMRGTVHLYEPVPHLAQLCGQTLRGSRFRAEVHPYGLAEADATTEIFVAADGNLGWNTLVAEATRQEMTRVPIQLRAFDAASVDGVPTFVKIDVEGAEHRVLEGLWPALVDWSPRPVILCEIGWGTGHPQWAEELEVLRRLEDELGYRAESLEGDAVDLAAIDRTTDVIFVPGAR